MKFKITVKDSSGQWDEEYDKDIDDPMLWALEIVERFNATLKIGEIPRELVDVVITDDNNSKFHKWVKRTDGMSVRFRGQIVDLMYCSNCGITGKRFGLSGTVKIDSKYRKKVFQNCAKAKEELRFLRNL